jgi:hypothetical protein
MPAWKFPHGVEAQVGENNADNVMLTDNVVANADGSVFERLEAIKDQVETVSELSGSVPGTFFPGLGYNVVKLGTVATTLDALFVASGKSIVTMMVGEVTSVVATTTSLQLATSVGGVLCASTDIVTEVAGTLYMLTGDPDDILSGQANVVGLATSKTGNQSPFFINNNQINQLADGAGTGLIEWNLWYIPVEAGATITSAA